MPKRPKNIYRTPHGYRVSIQRDHQLHVKYFSRLQYGSLSSALSAAKQHLKDLRQTINTSPTSHATQTIPG